MTPRNNKQPNSTDNTLRRFGEKDGCLGIKMKCIPK